MYFQILHRPNSQSGEYERYCCLKESFRDAAGTTRNRTVLTTGFEMSELSYDELQLVARGLNSLYEKQKAQKQGVLPLGGEPEFSDKVNYYIHKYWSLIVQEKRLDIIGKAMEHSEAKARRLIDTETLEHKDAREIGTEWLCLQALRELGFEDFLRHEGWDEQKIRTAVAHLIVRTAYCPSENKSYDYMHDNSAVCELLSFENQQVPSRTSLYKVAPELYKIKDKIEKYLCAKTDSLFDFTDTLILFDLTNFYFEGRKDGSQKAQFGRSKEKRSDCKIIVLALCVNKAGFIRYSEILEGNAADPNTLGHMVGHLIKRTGQKKVLLVFDAGITTEENLRLVKEHGYDYLCVSRKNLTDRQITSTGRSLTVFDTKGQEITLTEVKSDKDGDYYLKIESPAKALKESSMNRKFKERFEEGMQRIQSSLTKKHGVKNYDKVVERVGRLKSQFPSVSRYYVIEYERDDKNKDNMSGISWRLAFPDSIDSGIGTYYLRSNVHELDEQTVWAYYNIIREIECTFRQLNTDLNLRPIYHQTDANTEAHLFLGLLSYWIVNTIRHKLKAHGDSRYWTEIHRVMSTQKAVTSTAVNALGEEVKMRICTRPTLAAAEIYKRLGYRPTPFRKIEICTSQMHKRKAPKNYASDS